MSKSLTTRASPGAPDAAVNAAAERRAAPWWRFGMVWLVIAGPACVAVAGFATTAIAFRHADVVLVQPAAPGTSTPSRSAPTAPALQARNHAATPAR